MPSLLASQCVLLATAVALSAGTILLFDLFKYSEIPQKQTLRSCLSSGSEKKKKNNKMKRVQFTDDGKQLNQNGEFYRRDYGKRTEIQRRSFSSYGDEILGLQKMPPNRAALYAGILRDRLQREQS